jgi:hypothetical protein
MILVLEMAYCNAMAPIHYRTYGETNHDAVYDHLRGPRKRHTRGSASPMVDFDANWLTFASHLALSVEKPNSWTVVALLFWKSMIGQ